MKYLTLLFLYVLDAYLNTRETEEKTIGRYIYLEIITF